jgi:adenosylcobinamide-GDP ribazoletransferase
MLKTFYAALVFYTALPIGGKKANLDFNGIAVYAPLVGIIIGILLVTFYLLTGYLALAFRGFILQSVLVTMSWIWITGGLHLDGAMDTADGLAVTDPSRRLEVMADSHTGAFGVMAALAVILLKFGGMATLQSEAIGFIVLVPAWGRWAQLYAINNHIYLKPEGKGKFHKAGVSSWQVWLMGAILGLFSWVLIALFSYALASVYLSILIVVAFTVSNWFNWQLGGQTGDSYGAIVEWTEAIALVLIAIVHSSRSFPYN